MMERPIGYLEPFEGESISHYLGRYRRQPIVSVSSAITLGLATECGSIFHRWERFFFNPRPSAEEIELVSGVIGLTETELIKLLPETEKSVLIEPIRLCAACYRKNPWHRMLWQYKSCRGCELHELKLLTHCPGCILPFSAPIDWLQPGACQQCGYPFSRMFRKQSRLN